MALRGALYIVLFVASALCCASTATTPHQLSDRGGLDGLVGLMLSSNARSGVEYQFDERGVKLKLLVRSHRSSPSVIDENDNRCTANSLAHKVVCDLGLIDSLAKQFGLTGRYKFLSLKDSRALYKRVLLKWMIAHEIGHIALDHAESDWEDPPRGLLIFDNAQQAKELAADKYAMDLVGNLETAGLDEYAVVLQIANALLAQALCPKTYPKPCEKLHPGVGLIYNSAIGEAIRIQSGGKHPAFVARFVRLLYLAGEGTNQNSINYLAKQVLNQLEIEQEPGSWVSAREALSR